VTGAVMEGVRAVAAAGGRSAPPAAPITATTPGLSDDPLQYVARLEWLYDRLADTHSRSQLINLVGATMGGQRLWPPGMRQAVTQMTPSAVDAFLVRNRVRGSACPDVHRYRIPGVHGPLNVETRRDDIFNTFIIERFAYDHDGVTIRAQAGHVVIDGESGLGDTALYFADRVGHGGEVHAIEPDVRKVTSIRANCSNNPSLGYHTIMTVGALSDRAGDWVTYEADGPLRLLLRPDPWSLPVAKSPTVSVDALVAREMIARIDFIKLDVSEAETALRGAHETIQTYQPILAIALRHRADDLVSIQPRLVEISDGYDFYLDHVAVDGAGAVLFAGPRLPRPRG
jgi:FkbM family methyltransferase